MGGAGCHPRCPNRRERRDRNLKAKRGSAMELWDQVALVTGAGSGIGRAVALGLAREGAHLGLIDIDTEKDLRRWLLITKQNNKLTDLIREYNIE